MHPTSRKIHKNKNPNTIHLVFFLVAATTALALGWAKYSKSLQQKQVEKEKGELLAQIEKLEQSNSTLQKSLAYIDSPEYKEKIARSQLNLKKDGEIVYHFTEPADFGTGEEAVSAPVSNFTKWKNYFFRPD